tara:strand:- start:940 stop:1266 length:327 start_codon:yes stop_codon:yes gene_type:complete
MANTFLRQSLDTIGTSAETLYTVPANKTAVLIGGLISNTTNATCNATVTVTIGSDVISLIGTNTPIPANTALSFIDGKIVVQTTDVVKVTGSVANALDAHLSYMEIDV